MLKPRVIVSSAVLLATLLVSLVPRTAFAQSDPQEPAFAGPAPQAAPPLTPSRPPSGILDEPGFLSSALDFANDRFGERTGRPKNGFYPEFSNMITGSGWISAGPGYRHFFAGDQGLFDTSAAISWHLYKMAQARVEFPGLANEHLVVGVQGMWQDNTQVNYFGIGDGVSEDARSQYRLQTTDVVGYGILSPRDWLSFTGKFGWLASPTLMDPGGTFLRDFPSTRTAFPGDPAVTLSEQPSFWHSGASIAADTRDHRGHPTRGFLYRGALINYWDRDTDFYSFDTWEGEALHYVPLAGARVVLAFHGWTVSSNPVAGHDIPFYLLPTIGGSRTLRDYHDFQFHDNNLLLLSAETRFAVWEHLDAAVFGDAGNVARKFTDLNLDKTSYGVGLRLHSDTTTLMRFDVARGELGWNFIVSTSEPFRLPRSRRRIATVPFTP